MPDRALQASFAETEGLRAGLGIGGHFNVSPNDGTITRFGWKAQNKSLLFFAGEAYNVEMGVSNELFPNEIAAVDGCVFNPAPEDTTNLTPSDSSGSAASDYASDIVNFAAFSRLSAPPAAQELTGEGELGRNIFQLIGCQACHTVSLTTGSSSTSAAMSGVTFHPFSDFALHRRNRSPATGL